MRTTFIFITFLILRASCLSRMLMKDQILQEYSPKKCFARLTQFYTNSEGLEESIESDEAILSVCPGLKESCCSKETLKGLQALAVQSVEALEEFKKQYSYLVTTIGGASQSVLKSISKQLQEKFKEQVDEEDEDFVSEIPEEATVFNQAAAYIKKNKSAILKNLESAVAFVESTNSRFGCAVCHPENQYSFQNMKSKKPTLVLDMAQCKDIYSDPRVLSLFKVDADTKYVYDVITSLILLDNDSGPNEVFLTEEEVEGVPAFVQDCLEGNNFFTKESCKHLCKDLNFLNGNPFYGIESAIISGYLYIDVYFKRAKKKEYEELLQEFTNLEHKIKKKYFIMPLLKNDFYIETFEKNLAWNSGWNIMNFQMNYNVPLQIYI